MTIPLFVIVAYLGLTTALGIWLARRATTSAHWAIAGSQMSVLMVAAGVAGTRVGGAATYGVAGNVLSGGVWNLWWYAAGTFLALALLGRFFAVPYRRLQIRTVGEVFLLRFGSRRCQSLTSLCVQTEYAVVNVIEAYLIGAILKALTGMPMWTAVLIAAAVLVSYTALGGLWGAAATNVIHCVAMFAGLLLVVVLGIADAGGWSVLTTRIDSQLADAAIDSSAWWSPVGGGWMPILAMVFAAAAHTPAASIYCNFASATRDENRVLAAFLLAGAVAAVMPFLSGIVGMLTLARYGRGEGLAGYANITALATTIGPWVGGAALAAVMGAVVSSGGPVLLSSATMFVRDWWRPARRYSSEQELSAYRWTTAVYGLLAALAAWLVSGTSQSLLDLLLLGYAIVVPPAIALGYALYWPRATEPATFWGIIAGYAGGVFSYALDHWLGSGRFNPTPVTTLVPLFTIPIVSLATARTPEARDGFYLTLARASPRTAEP